MIGIDVTHARATLWNPQNHWPGLYPTSDQMVDEGYLAIDVSAGVAPFTRGVRHA